jgi:hypothetical protein
LKEIPNLLKNGNLQDAEKTILEAEASWPPEDKDERAQQINEYKNEIKQQLEVKQQAQKELIEEVDRLVNERKLFAAKALLATDETLPNIKSKQRDIDNKIKQAQNLFQNALTGGANQDQKIELCRQVLALCTDYQDAKDLLRTMPPSPPKNLRATTRGKVVSLEWEPSPTKGCAYIIVRKSGAQPNTIKDGVLLDTVTGETYDDTSPEIGLPLYYAVFAVLDTVSSPKPVYLRQSVIVVQNVLRFDVAKVDSHLVTLSWEPPPYVDSIIIVRKEQSRPNSFIDGTRLPYVTPAQKTVEDRDVQNDHTYHYGIYCQFEDANGQPQTSSGAFVEVIPRKPPTPIADKDVEITEKQTDTECEVRISWPPPEKDTKVIILKSSQPLRKEGLSMPETNLIALGNRLEGQTDSVTDVWTDFGIAYYTPVVIFQKMGYIGTSKAYAYIENVQHLRYQNTGSVIQLQWDWPDQCEEVLISYHEQYYPQHYEQNATTCSLSLEEYDHMGGHYAINGRGDQRFFIVVSAVVVHSDEKIPSQGTRTKALLAKPTVLDYQIKHSGFLGKKKRILHITTSSLRSLPTLLLISKRNGLPFDKNDGKEFHSIDLPVIMKRDIAIPLPNDTLPPDTFVKLFLKDDDWHDEIRINHPYRDDLRLS